MIDVTAPDPLAELDVTVDLLRAKHIELVPVNRTPSIQGLLPLGYLVALNKADLAPSGELAELVTTEIGGRVPTRIISARTGSGLEDLKRDLFALLKVIRIYTKEPGKPPDMRSPFTVPRGTTVLEFAARVHHDFVEHFKSARVWGSGRFDGQSVPRDRVFQDRDI
ncbi:MAG: TGS domain-containing protein, partial [Kiritimatiellia bacterium]